MFQSQSDINGDDEMEGEEMEMEDVFVSIIPQPLPEKTIRVQFLTTKQVMSLLCCVALLRIPFIYVELSFS